MIKRYAMLAGAVVLGLILLAAGGAWVFRLGPFATGPSAATKLQPKIADAVADTQKGQDKAADKLEDKTNKAAVAVDQRTANHVAEVRKSTARAVPADVPDDAFCRGVRASKLYAGTEAGCGYRR